MTFDGNMALLFTLNTHTMTHKELLEKILYALNQIPNTGVRDDDGNRTSTYTLASEISKALEDHSDEPKKKYVVNVVWDREGADYAEEHGFEAAVGKTGRWGGTFSTDSITFDTEAEANAYMQGIGDGNGWDQPWYELAKL